jgi:hypothetical protein
MLMGIWQYIRENITQSGRQVMRDVFPNSVVKAFVTLIIFLAPAGLGYLVMIAKPSSTRFEVETTIVYQGFTLVGCVVVVGMGFNILFRIPYQNWVALKKTDPLFEFKDSTRKMNAAARARRLEAIFAFRDFYNQDVLGFIKGIAKTLDAARLNPYDMTEKKCEIATMQTELNEKCNALLAKYRDDFAAHDVTDDAMASLSYTAFSVAENALDTIDKLPAQCKNPDMAILAIQRANNAIQNLGQQTTSRTERIRQLIEICEHG